MTDLDQLEALLAKATPGEWDVAPYYTGTGPDEVCRGMLVVDDDWPIGIISENDPPLGDTLSDDLDLIAALRNAAPDLIAKARRVEALEAALRKIAAECCVPLGADKQMYARWRQLAADRVDIARAALKENTDG